MSSLEAQHPRRGGVFAWFRFERESLVRTRLARVSWLGFAVPLAWVLAGTADERTPFEPGEAAAMLTQVVLWSSVFGAGALALASAHPTDADAGRRWLLLLHGFELKATRGMRLLAALAEIASRLALTWSLAFVALLRSNPLRALTPMLAPLGAYGLVVAATLASLAAWSGEVGGRRGRTLFLAVVLAPWIWCQAFPGASASIPSALARVWFALTESQFARVEAA